MNRQNFSVPHTNIFMETRLSLVLYQIKFARTRSLEQFLDARSELRCVKLMDTTCCSVGSCYDGSGGHRMVQVQDRIV